MTYIYKEYPRTMHKANAQVCTVRDDAEKAAALASGWSLLPVMDAPEAPAVAEPAAPQDEAPAEAEPVEDETPKKRGRKARG